MVNVKYAGLNIILTENSFSIMSFFFYMAKVSFAKSYIKKNFKDFTANNIFVYMLSCDKIILIAKEKRRRTDKKRKKTNKQTRNKNNFSAWQNLRWLKNFPIEPSCSLHRFNTTAVKRHETRNWNNSDHNPTCICFCRALLFEHHLRIKVNLKD